MMLSQTTLLEVIKALVADELKSIRRLGTHELPTDEWNAETLISANRQNASTAISLQADSMEWLSLAGRVMQFFNLQDTGYEDYLLRYKTLGEWAELVAIARKDSDVDSASTITFHTSGSTGKPKAVQHHWQNLVAEAETFKSYFEMLFEPPRSQPINRVIALCPSHHIYGFLFTALLPEIVGDQPIPVLRGFKAFSTVQAGALQDGDLIIGLPHMWQQLQRSGTEFKGKVIGVSSTGPCPKSVIDALKTQGLSHFIEIYGSTETGGVGVRRNAKQGFELLPRWNRCPDAGAESEAQGTMLVDVNSHDKVTLCDHLDWLNQRQFVPTGRIDNAVQVGGINVFPDQVAAQLESHPGVAKAAVRLMHEDEGERLKAFIVPRHPQANPEQLIEALEQWCQAHLPAVANPKQYTFGAELPRNTLGKIGDWA